MKTNTAVNTNSSVYYKNTYWNDIPLIYKYICKNLTNSEKTWWIDDFKKRYAKKPFKNALFLNCGNGHVEREFIDKNIVVKASAFDYSYELLKKAQQLKKARDITYFQADANMIRLKKNTYDLVVNVAGLHHVQYINKLMYQLSKCLTKDGLMVNFDYVGPHRNQYGYAHWKLVNKINKSFPPKIRHDNLSYPSIPVMLKEDPTEAIHSELILPTMTRYFDIFEKHDAGGGLAYLLFTHNHNIFKNQKNSRVNKEIQIILNFERNLSYKGIIPNLFAYFIARPNSTNIINGDIYKRHQKNEDRREFCATLFGHVYRPEDVVSLIVFKIKKVLKQILFTSHE